MSGQTSTSKAITGLADSTEYRFRMRAVRTFSNPPFTIESQSWSGVATAATPPAVPSGLSATAHSNTAIKISWEASTPGTEALTGYDVQRCTGSQCGDSGAGWTDFNPNPALTGTSTSATVTGLSANTAYKIRIRAKNSSENSGWATSASVTTFALAAPTSFNTYASTTVNSAYTYSSDTWDGGLTWSSSAPHFEYERCISAVDDENKRPSSAHTVTCETYTGKNSLTDTNAACSGSATNCFVSIAVHSGLTYKYRVRACSASACNTGTSAWVYDSFVSTPYPACARKQTPDCPN